MKKAPLLTALVVFTGLAAQAAPFSQVVVFGDSLTDTGNAFLYTGGALPATPPYFGGRFSDGPLWIDYVGAALGLPVNPFLAGGTNYAAGGAETGTGGIVPGTGVSSQVAVYLTANPSLDPNALFVLTGGGNDLIAAVSGADVAAATQAAQNLLDRADDIIANGGKHLLMANSANVGLTPAVNSAGGLAIGTALTQTFNDTLATGIAARKAAHPDVQITFVNQDAIVNAIVQDALANSGATFGITDITTPCIGNQGACGNSLWFDDQHPTTRAHLFYAQASLAALSSVPEPSSLALSALAGVVALVARRRANRTR